LDARLLNSELAKVGRDRAIKGPGTAAPAAAARRGDGGGGRDAWRCALLTAEQNALVRSQNDACEARVGFMAAGRAAVDLRPGSGSRPSPEAELEDAEP
jgi:hypothetical protein